MWFWDIFKIIYLDLEDIPKDIDVIRKERSDDKGNELWFTLMTRYMEESSYGVERDLKGLNGLLTHIERRKTLKHRIINEVFNENTITVKSKNYVLSDLNLF